MKRFAISTAIAGGLFAGLLGATGAANATTMSDLAAPMASAATVLPTEEDGGEAQTRPCSLNCIKIAGQWVNREDVPAPAREDSGCQNSSPLGVVCYDWSFSPSDLSDD